MRTPIFSALAFIWLSISNFSGEDPHPWIMVTPGAALSPIPVGT